MPAIALPRNVPGHALTREDKLRGHPCYKCPKKYLKKYGIEHKHWPHREILLFFTATVCLSLWTHLLRTHLEARGFEEKEIFVAIWTLGVLLLGYQQWQETRHEISLDKYYERLEIANRKREFGSATVCRMLHSEEECSREQIKKNMLIYAELDNLEYMIEKYRLGFMDPEQACRGLRTFQHRCGSPEFRSLAKARVWHNDYGVHTREVVQNVLAEIETPARQDAAEVMRRWSRLLDVLSRPGLRLRPQGGPRREPLKGRERPFPLRRGPGGREGRPPSTGA